MAMGETVSGAERWKGKGGVAIVWGRGVKQVDGRVDASVAATGKGRGAKVWGRSGTHYDLGEKEGGMRGNGQTIYLSPAPTFTLHCEILSFLKLSLSVSLADAFQNFLESNLLAAAQFSQNKISTAAPLEKAKTAAHLSVAVVGSFHFDGRQQIQKVMLVQIDPLEAALRTLLIVQSKM